MPIPLWAVSGAAVQTIEPPYNEGWIDDTDERTGNIRIRPLNGPQGSNPLWVNVVDLGEMYRPHRWIERVEELARPYRGRAIYRPRPGRMAPEDSVWEAQAAQPFPSWMVRRGDDLFRLRDGKVVKVTSVTRAGQVNLSDGGSIEQTNLTSLSKAFVPFYDLTTVRNWRGWDAPTDEVEILHSTNEEVRCRTAEGDEITLSLGALFSRYDPAIGEYEIPRWIHAGNVIRHAATGMTALIEDIVFVGRRPMVVAHFSTPGEGPRVTEFTIDYLLLEWEPLPDEERVTLPEEGTFWVWENPPALLEIEAANSAYVDVKLLPSARIERVPSSEFSSLARRHAVVQLKYRNTTSRPGSLRVGQILDVSAVNGPVAVGSVAGGQLTVYTQNALVDVDGSILSDARPKLRTPPGSLGFPPVSEVLAVSETTAIDITLCVFIGPNDLVEVTWPEGRDKPIVSSMVDLTLPGQPVGSYVVVETEPRVFVRPVYFGKVIQHKDSGSYVVNIHDPHNRIRTGDRILLSLDHQLPLEYTVMSMGDEGVRVDLVCCPGIEPMIVSFSSEEVVPEPKTADKTVTPEWLEITSRRRCLVVGYNERARTARVRWLVSGTPEEEIPVSTLLHDFRCLTRGGADRVQEIASAPGRGIWERLLD